MSLFETGKDMLVHEFKELLVKHSKAVPPAIIIRVISNEEGVLPLPQPSPLIFHYILLCSLSLEDLHMHQFPPEVASNLIKMADWLIIHNEDDYMNVCKPVNRFSQKRPNSDMIESSYRSTPASDQSPSRNPCRDSGIMFGLQVPLHLAI